MIRASAATENRSSVDASGTAPPYSSPRVRRRPSGTNVSERETDAILDTVGAVLARDGLLRAATGGRTGSPSWERPLSTRCCESCGIRVHGLGRPLAKDSDLRRLH